MCAIYRYQKK